MDGCGNCGPVVFLNEPRHVLSMPGIANSSNFESRIRRYWKNAQTEFARDLAITGCANRLKARVVIYAYQQHVRLFSPEPVVVTQPQSTRVEELTLLCN